MNLEYFLPHLLGSVCFSKFGVFLPLSLEYFRYVPPVRISSPLLRAAIEAPLFWSSPFLLQGSPFLPIFSSFYRKFEEMGIVVSCHLAFCHFLSFFMCKYVKVESINGFIQSEWFDIAIPCACYDLDFFGGNSNHYSVKYINFFIAGNFGPTKFVLLWYVFDPDI